MTELEKWLTELGLDKYHDVFRRHAVDMDVLPELTDHDLIELGIPVGDRRRIMKAAAGPSEAPQASTSKGFEAERRQLTVMFCDLVGSTALSAQLDAEEYRDLLRDYQDSCMTVVGRYEGTIARAYGDGLLIYFGYPVAHDDEAARAVLAGFDIIESVAGLRSHASLSEDSPLQVRIGIHTGQVVVGGLRADDLLDPMGITGDAANIAARLQELASPDSIVVSHATRRLAGDVANFEPQGERTLKGLPYPVEIYLPSRRDAAAAQGVPDGTMPATGLVGREVDLMRLTDAWRRSATGDTRAALIVGPPGIGKSRLVTSLAQDLESHGVQPIQIRCSSLHVQSPFCPIAELFTRQLGIASVDKATERLQKLEGMVDRAGLKRETAMPLLAPILSIPATDEYPKIEMPAERQIVETINTIVRCLGALAEGRQPVLMFEDLHWMDSSTLGVVHHLIEADVDHPMFVVGTFRPDFDSPWDGAPNVDTLVLNQLEGNAVREIIRRIAGEASFSEDVIEYIVSITDRVPLFVEELTKSVLEAQSLGDLPSSLTREHLDAKSIPASLQDSLLARLDRLGEARRVAQLGATIGREFSYQLLASIADLEAVTLRRHISRLQNSGLIFSKGQTGYERFVFKHVLVQNAAYSTLLRSDRQVYHRRIAEAVAAEAEKSGVPQPQLLAHHYTEAGELLKAVPCWLTAGEHAAERHAIPEAISQLNTGLELIGQLEETPERIRLELRFHNAIAMPIASSRGYTAPELRSTLERAQNLCHQLGNPKQLFPVLHGMLKFYLAQADHVRAESLGLELLEIADNADDTSLRIEAHRNIGMSYALSGKFVESVQHCDLALSLYDSELHRSHALLYAVDPAVVALAFSSYSKWALGEVDKAAERIQRAIEYAGELKHPYSEAFALSSAASVFQYRREPERTLANAQRAIEISRQHGFPYWIGWSTVPLGWALCVLGKCEQGLATIRRGLDGYEAAGVLAGRPQRQCLYAEAVWIAGDATGALEIVRQVAAFPELALDMYHSEVHRLRGDLELADDPGRTDAARAAYEQALAIAREQRAAAFELRTLVSMVKLDASVADDAASSLDELRAAYARFDQGQDTPDLGVARSLLETMPEMAR